MNLADKQNIHPFFTKPHRAQSPEHPDDPESAAADAQSHDEDQTGPDEVAQRPRPRGRPLGSKTRGGKRKSGGDNAGVKVKQASLADFTQGALGPKKESENSGNSAGEATSLEEDPNISRRKRQKTASPAPELHAETPAVEGEDKADQPQDQPPSWIDQLRVEAIKGSEDVQVAVSTPDSRDVEPPAPSSDVVLGTSPQQLPSGEDMRQTPPPASSPPVAQSSPSKAERTPRKRDVSVLSSPHKASPPKKMLRINAKGRFSSPVSKEAEEEVSNTGTQRKTRSRAAKKPKQLIVKMSYIKDDDKAVRMAEDIDLILSGAKQVPIAEVQKQQKQSEPSAPPAVSKPTGPPKPTHPFFGGKAGRKGKGETRSGEDAAAQPPPSSKPVGRRETAITPGKLRAHTRAADDGPDFPSFGFGGGSTKQRRVLGSADAPWPWKGVTRVEEDAGHGFLNAKLTYQTRSSEPSFKQRRKFKGLAFEISDNEALLANFVRDLRDSLDAHQEETAYSSSTTLRLPQRLLTTGPEIQRAVQAQVLAFQSTVPEDHLALSERSPHPALTQLFESIASTLTPFDKGVCETLPWTHKYAPRCAADVLGSAREVAVLRKWLESLKVTAVEGGVKESGKSFKSKKGAVAKQTAAKKRKKDDLDDFVVSDEDGLDELDELTDPDDSSRPGSSHGGKKSMIRFGGDGTNLDGGKKLHNLILLSGPHGSGKTASVHAVAKELGFEVFEINPGSRRSGKDVLDKIGDMTENHLVQRRAREQPEQVTVDSDTERLSDAVQKDIESGRQKSMSSFFKPVGQAKPKAPTVVKKEPEVRILVETTQPTLIKPKHSQKQSLILLEEVDILFDDDKNFWQTVEHLAVHSRRPIVMTCTDESLIKIPETALHAILRLTPAPAELVADYLLLLAAREGHLLQRNAVASLYESKNYDLRASLTELNFWCQMAVGDRKGGLEWMYQRWPPGKDVDEHGQTLRVASKDTYESGMGWVGRDMVLERNHVGFDREFELLLELTESWNIEPETCSSSSPTTQQDNQEQSSQKSNLKALQDMDHLMGYSSAADVYCRVGVPTRDQALMDPTQPDMLEKARANFVEGYRFLQDDPVNDYSRFDTHLAVSSHLAVRRCSSTTMIPSTYSSNHGSALSYLNEPTITSTILSHLSLARERRQLHRPDFFVFDPLAEPPTAALSTTSNALVASSFDREFRIIAEDLAPYVRNIAAADLRIENERLRVSGLLSAGGKPPKRQRTTRAARSALEGSRREATRRARWFDRSLNLVGVLKTAGQSWAGLGSLRAAEEKEGTEHSEVESTGSRSVEAE